MSKPLLHYYKRNYFSNHHLPQSQALLHLPFSPLAENFLQRALCKTPCTASLSPLSPLPNASGYGSNPLYTSPYPSGSQGSFLETQTRKPHFLRFFFDWPEMRPRNPPDPQQLRWCRECWGWHHWSTVQHGSTDDHLFPLGSSLAGIKRLHLSAIFTFMVQICSVSSGGSFFFCLSPLRCWLPLRHHISWTSLLLIQDATQLHHHWARSNHQLRMLSLLIFPFPDYSFLITFFLYHMSSSLHWI